MTLNAFIKPSNTDKKSWQPPEMHAIKWHATQRDAQQFPYDPQDIEGR